MDSVAENTNREIKENKSMDYNHYTNRNRNSDQKPTSHNKSEIADKSKHHLKQNQDHSNSEAEEEYILFFGKESPFSQHHLAKFEIEGIKFNCAEQYMMYMKAVTFRDEEIKQEILEATEPRIQKRLGRQVRNFDVDIWMEKARDVVKRATEEKFSQNPHLKKILLETYPKPFVECNPHDRIWGIGLSQKAPEARDPSKWKGKNLLGEIITEVRNKLYDEETKYEIMENKSDQMHDNHNQNRKPTSRSKSEIADKSKHHLKQNQNYLKSEVKEEYILFFGKQSPFSQHHPAEFEIDGIKFNCAWQYMMYMKAVTFHDEEMKQEILKATEPGIQTSLGRRVRNFDMKIWIQKARDVVKRATEEKFSQNPHLKKILLETYPKIFVECNPHDRIWGIGLSQKAPEARDRSKWKGKNLLGEIITEVRNKLYEEDTKYEIMENKSDQMRDSHNQNQKPTSKFQNLEATVLHSDTKEESEDHSKSEVKEEYILFFGKQSPFSQNHPAEFEIDGIKFNCARQYMMYMKAVTFHDEEIKQEILKATKPGNQTRLGSKVRNFNEDIWMQKAWDVVKRATELKFLQNSELKKRLLETYPKIFVECNPHDSIWGTGLKMTAPEAKDPSKWKGKNLLGKIITEVRNKLYLEEQALNDKKQ